MEASCQSIKEKSVEELLSDSSTHVAASSMIVVERGSVDEDIALSSHFLNVFVETARLDCVRDNAEARYRESIDTLTKIALSENMTR